MKMPMTEDVNEIEIIGHVSHMKYERDEEKYRRIEEKTLKMLGW
jgi:hypothetical protein